MIWPESGPDLAGDPSSSNPDLAVPRGGAREGDRVPTRPVKTTTAPSLPTSIPSGEGGGTWIEELVGRGVEEANAQTLVASHDPGRVWGAIGWFDSQRAGSVGPGLLVRAVQEGRVASPRRSMLDEQQEYGESICDWLNERFPGLRQASGRPHPAAIAAVIRLHFRDGKGSLTRQRHGVEIRAAVDAWHEAETLPVGGSS